MPPNSTISPTQTGSPGIFNPGTCPHRASSILAITFRLHHPGTGFPGRLLLHSVVIACLSLQFGMGGGGGTRQRQWFARWPYIFDGSKNCWFFSLFSFLLIVRTEWQLLRSLYAGPETRNLFCFDFQSHLEKKKKGWYVFKCFFCFSPLFFPLGLQLHLSEAPVSRWGSVIFLKKKLSSLCASFRIITLTRCQVSWFCYGPSSVNPC